MVLWRYCKRKTGFYLNNQLDKQWTYWSDSGKKTKVITYSNGMKNGSYMIWNADNFKTIDGQYQNVKDKLWTIRYDDGTIKAKESYSKGEKDGKWTWYRPDGNIDKEGSYKNSVQHGLWISWADSDKKKSEETFVNGVLDGEIINWYDNGNIDREGIIRGNKKEGNWTYYNGDGSVDFKFDYGTGLERVRIAELEERDNIFYKIGKYKPYTGIVTESGGIKDYLLLGRFKSGKRDGQWVQWYRNGNKEIDGVYYRGKSMASGPYGMRMEQ